MSDHLDYSSTDVIDTLIAAETHFSPLPDHLRRLSVQRQDSINWILNAHAHYQFRPITAVLSVKYFDQFLSSVPFEWNKGWEFQLLAVACLSLAVKMEEVEVPLLIDLQVSEPRFVFESKTIQKMELLVMNRLDWRLRSVTPFDYFDYFIFKIYSGSVVVDEVYFRWKCSDLVIKTTRAIDFLEFRPSVIAAAAAICVAGDGVDVPESFYGKVNKVMVRSCHQLMNEYLMDTCPLADHKVRKRSDEPPPSPDGVLDVAATCVSCDTRSGENGRQAKRVRSSNVQEEKI